MQNLANFKAHGELGELLSKSRQISRFNQLVKPHLPEDLQALELCHYDDQTGTFITPNQALAFRAQQQQSALLNALIQVPELKNLTIVKIKVDITG